jgi:pyrroloquinoline quinone biosynthesis protein B
MHDFLQTNQPFSVMYRNGNIKPIILDNNDTILLTDNVKVIASKVDHRADFTDTFAFKIYGSIQNMFFCPDIDSWNNMTESLPVLAESMDILLLDSTFYDDNELIGRDMSSIPHPRVVDTISLLQDKKYKSIVFIHINHSNKLWSDNDLVCSLSDKRMIVGKKGMMWSI